MAINKALKFVAQLSIDKASQALSRFIKNGARIEMDDIYMADISEITGKLSEKNDEVVGAFIDLGGDVKFKFLFFVNAQDSCLLADLILRRPVGTTKTYDQYTSSAVQEIANILSCGIASVFTSDFQLGITISPPTVIHDFVGTVFLEYFMSIAVEQNEVMMIETTFKIVQQNVNCHMFIIPDSKTEKVLSYISNTL